MEYRFIFLFIFVFGNLNATDIPGGGKEYQKGVILYEGKKMIRGDYFFASDDKLFIRDEQFGRFISKSKSEGIVSEDYVESIRSKERWQAVSESFYLFSSGNKYQSGALQISPDEEMWTRIAKISLVLITGYYYQSAVRANEQLSHSFYGLNSDQKRSLFERENTKFQLSLVATVLTFLGSGFFAYYRYDRDLHFNQLNIREREFVPVESIPVSWNLPQKGAKIELGYSKNF
ncbi:hypothetical protein LPTSP3_g24470 [Leptospira kobayashii]|uniref:DUF5683 domain-containing protein n=1 Tax=Leptospira kobayashii TaxID=1917830 RepID=A0ABN6KHK9_9LEPT|nr:hypothetical protein [Leptospira kobayashii]BDA79517.1 hypothetical protein LPTSP3_g24470 [Leptospira kobayashii]